MVDRVLRVLEIQSLFLSRDKARLNWWYTVVRVMEKFAEASKA
ncbi:unnamed protein product [Arabidopsis lyrata]|nr:unnamed protein product [Arabidopsis lyrata]